MFRVYLKPSGFTGIGPYSKEPGSNGLTMDSKGRLVSCEHGDRRVSVLEQGYGKRTLVDNYMGKRLNSPNDVIFDSHGNMFFTDPPYGLPKQADDPAVNSISAGCTGLSQDGKLTLLTKETDSAERYRVLARRENSVCGAIRSQEGDLDGVSDECGWNHRQGPGIRGRDLDGGQVSRPARRNEDRP